MYRDFIFLVTLFCDDTGLRFDAYMYIHVYLLAVITQLSPTSKKFDIDYLPYKYQNVNYGRATLLQLIYLYVTQLHLAVIHH